MPHMDEPLLLAAPKGHNKGPNTTLLGCLWGAVVQAFTVEDVFQRKIK